MDDFQKRYEFLKVLAEGAYGKVILAKCKQINEGELVAIKVFIIKQEDKDAAALIFEEKKSNDMECDD